MTSDENANANTDSLGDCPHCETMLSRRHVLVEYETAAGQKHYAECPQCQDVVRPQPE
ncbi:DUF7837 family putative zinc-binding protein [Halostella litorea]|uniref:DUF7837 family putative zinc-binding protein n=1 Tax=Halostella litorea TaxID=2528831 RepID=UPI00192A63A4|nr:hypothetical protein [Halostella litorea]